VVASITWGLGGYKGAEGEKGGVDGTSVVQERANDFLESCEARGVQGGRVVFYRR
jgi:hypothetical protein